MGDMSDATTEVRVAVQWWADQLSGDPSPTHTGNVSSEMLTDLVKSAITKPTGEQVKVFREHLKRALLAMVLTEDWADAVSSGNPQLGSAFRKVSVGYGPDKILDDAMVAAGLPRLTRQVVLPLKTTMWINPGSVSVGLGYNTPAVELDLTPQS
jgi:hypothetical protein